MNFADLPEFHGFVTARNITSTELRHLHYKNWRLKICIWWLFFSSCSPQGNLRIFFNFKPCISSYISLCSLQDKQSVCCCFWVSGPQEDWEHSASQIEILLALIVHFLPVLACLQDFDGNEPMAKPLTSWLVPSFSQHNLRLVVSGHCLHVLVTKFQDKFAEINFKYVVQTCISQDFYQILRYFACFCEFHRFTWISWLHDRAKYHKPWAASFTL